MIALAIGWHVSLVWIERSRRQHKVGPSLSKLLELAELDLLATLRAELVGLMHSKPKLKPRYRAKVEEVNSWLKRLGGLNGR
ncbi:MAG: hypothetical protein U9M97_00575 [Candidatus Hadarchaeota archaeon]|nr:hypothetical protein [Candidatus Hadarchaeota archaeon]